MREREVKHTKKYEKKKERGRKMNSKTMSKKMNISALIFYISLKTIQYTTQKKRYKCAIQQNSVGPRDKKDQG